MHYDGAGMDGSVGTRVGGGGAKLPFGSNICGINAIGKISIIISIAST